MSDLFGNQDVFQDEAEKPKKQIKFRFKCWNDDPNGISQQPFDTIEVDVYAEEYEDALKRVREVAPARKHHEIIKIHEPKS